MDVNELRELHDRLIQELDSLAASVEPVREGRLLDEPAFRQCVDAVSQAAAALNLEWQRLSEVCGIDDGAVTTMQAMLSLLDRIRSSDVERLRNLADYLRSLRIVTRLEATRTRLTSLCVDAASELEVVSAEDAALDGPVEAQEWFAWWWKLDSASADPLLERIAIMSASLAMFLGEVREDQIVVGRGEMPSPTSDGGLGEFQSQSLAEPTEDAGLVAEKVVEHTTDFSASEPAAHQIGMPPDSVDVVPHLEVLGPRTEIGGESAGSMNQDTATIVLRAPCGEANRQGREQSEHTAAAGERSASGSRNRPAVSRSRQPIPPWTRTLESFGRVRWISPTGTLEAAPWGDIGYCAKLEQRLRESLDDDNLAFAWIFSRAVQQLGGVPELDPDDLRSLAEIWAQPKSEAVGRNQLRLARVSSALSSGGAGSARLGLFLESIRPSASTNELAAALDTMLIDGVFRDARLQRVVEAMLRLTAAQLSPMDGLNAALRSEAAPTAEELEELLKEARQNLQTTFKALYSAAGGKVKFTHCRDAWDSFISGVHPGLKPLFLSSSKTATWSADDVGRFISRIPRICEDIADRNEVRFGDRKRMSRAGEELTDAALRVNDAYRRLLLSQKRASDGQAIQIPATELCEVLASTMPDLGEEICRRTLARAVGQLKPTAEPLGISFLQLARAPSLVSCLDVKEVSAMPRMAAAEDTVFCADGLVDLVRAAAIVMNSSAVNLDHGPISVTDYILDAGSMAGREDLDDYLLPILDERGLSKARNALDDRVLRIQDQIAGLDDLWRRLDDVGDLEADWVRQACQQAGQAILAGRSGPPPDLALVSAWLNEVREQAEALMVSARKAISEQAKRKGVGDVVELALKQHRYAEAIMALADQTEAAPIAAERTTLWRWTAEERWRGQSRETRRGGPGAEKLGDFWHRTVGDPPNMQTRKALLSHFCQYVFGFVEPGPELGEGFARVPGRVIRSHIARSMANPCFIPQLAQWESIVVAIPDIGVTSPQYTRNLAFMASKHRNSLVVFLAPAITPAARQRAMDDAAGRGPIRTALLDDIDFFRITNLEGGRPDPVLALLELALEQQPLSGLSPFGGHDGQNVSMEMYVGRRNEAELLAKNKRYSRLFSGRKLGKSALLRFVEEAVDKTLPSGNALQVFYVPIVGIDSESGFADRVLEHLAKRHPSVSISEATPPAERLIGPVSAVLAQNPTMSLLFVLDEADVFIEGQLETYEKTKERCITFRLRTEAESIKDSFGHPRVRFVFSGYRTTHTREGAWVNWGDPLVLSPLEPIDGQRLIAGPLARLGIDASTQAASIAYRCGYQPAVILKFGDVLLQQIGHRRTKGPGVRMEVDAPLVARVFEHNSVQEEITTVVGANFQGNEFGQTVFNAALLEFESLPTGAEISGLVSKIVERLDNMAGSAKWRGGEAARSTGGVDLAVRDLVTRSLVSEERFGSVSTYRLRFPHHLTILRRLDPAQQIRSFLAERATPGHGHGKSQIRSLLPAEEMANLREYLLGRHSDLDLACVAIGSLWMEGVLHPHGGIPARLGLRTSSDLPPSGLSADALAPRSTAVADRALSRWTKHSPAFLVVGGPDLLRWSAERSSDQGFTLERLGTGRLNPATLDWWFTRVWGIEFSKADDLRELVAKTGGIPPLVGLMESVIRNRSGETLQHRDAQEAFHHFDLGLAACANEFLGKLTARERQLLDLIRRASNLGHPGRPLGDSLTELGEFEELPCEPVGVDDKLSLELLILLGVVPAAVGAGSPFARLLCLEAQDPLHRIIEQATESTNASPG